MTTEEIQKEDNVKTLKSRLLDRGVRKAERRLLKRKIARMVKS